VETYHLGRSEAGPLCEEPAVAKRLKHRSPAPRVL